MSIKDRILKIKKWHSIISSFIFFSVLIFCSFIVKDNIFEISLSHFGVNSKTSTLWNGFLFLIGLLLWAESIKNLHYYFNPIPKILYFMFSISSIFLLITAVVDMSNLMVHNVSAVLYFLGFTISIFLFGRLLIPTNFRIGITSITISILSVINPLILVYLIPGLAIPEIVHTIIIFIWMLVMSWEDEYKNLLKKIGF